MHIFYCPDTVSVLNEEESRHAIQVLRLKKDDIVWLVDGKGSFYKVKITEPNYKACALEVIEESSQYGKRNYNLHIAIAPTKNTDRFEWFLEKTTEIGIDEITPLLCKHSERTVIKTDRLNKILISGIKQSIKASLPKLNELTKFNEFVKTPFEGQKFIAHCSSLPTPFGPTPIKEVDYLGKIYKPQNNVLILIGPE